jgi:hypothetical protein
MPGFDGTGPMGMGPMTGGGRGYCNPAGAGALPPRTYYRGGYPYGGYYRRPFGYWGAYPAYGSAGDAEALKAEIQALKDQVAELETIVQAKESGK